MENKYLDEALPFLQKISKKRREKFYTYFQNAPLWLLDSFQVENVPKETTFIRAGNPVDTIYFIGSGIIKGTDYRILGVSFDFMIFTDVYAYGGMEVIMDLDTYQTSLQTVTDCIILKIPKGQFAKWIKSDIWSLGHEAKLMGQYLLEQARNNRVFLFLQGADRLIMLFTIMYEQREVTGQLAIANDRQKLSDYTGLSVKTITRAVQKLEAGAMLTRTRSKLTINHHQYELMKKSLSEILVAET